MQKKTIISVVVVNILIGFIALLINFEEAKIESFFSILNSNQIRIYNQAGLTIKQMESIKAIEGVDQATFNNHDIFPTYSLSFDDDNKLVDVFGKTLETDNKYQQQLEFLAGSYLTAENQVIITESLANLLIENKVATSFENLIGVDLVENREIVGIYPDEITTSIEVSKADYPQVVGREYQVQLYFECENSFMTFNQGVEYDKQFAIDTYNMEYVAYKAGNLDKVKYNDDDSYSLNYKKSVANGAVGLIDPNTTEYGDIFNQYATINVDGDREQVVTELTTLLPEAAIVTADTKAKEVVSEHAGWRNFILLAIGLELLIVVPACYYGRKQQ